VSFFGPSFEFLIQKGFFPTHEAMSSASMPCIVRINYEIPDVGLGNQISPPPPPPPPVTGTGPGTVIMQTHSAPASEEAGSSALKSGTHS